MPKRKIFDEEKHQQVETPEEEGEQSISGDTPAPESDDDTLENVHKVGLYEDQDEEHPGELGIAEEIEEDEEERKRED
ncbi:MAG: hypothetical protein HYW45_04080 [Candidatus Daviesbacteria bacterium]|nr:MAG: hypothetical protein HYW45_04080 [Candidatus Daviesbacteria bacterium]